ncbi:acyltransferase family protein [Comamonas guangdongensis]|uniref:Acyltransferase family protein n=1 Tax=Comamonas guangdongensis TaxID=510515 RepID=A0ABV3ZV90_9BURK
MNKKYIDQLTWLRGFAAFLVVVSHSLRGAEVAYGAGDVGSKFLPLNLLDLGTFGVCLFFALSGCTLYISNASTVKTVRDIPSFYWKRLLRIWPAFAISMAVYIPFTKLFSALYTGNAGHWIGQFVTPYTLRDVLSYLSMSSDIFGPRTIINGAYWSLAIEFRYYLILPAVLILMRKKWMGVASCIVLSAVMWDVIHHQDAVPFDRPEFFQLGFTFFLGVAMAALLVDRPRRMRFSHSFLIFVGCVALVSAIRLDYIALPERGFFSDKTTCYGVLAVVCVFFALCAEPLKAKSWFLDHLYSYGLVSYSIYLYHMLFVGVAVLLIVRFELYGNYEKLAIIFPLTFFGSYFAGVIGYRFVEKPFIEMGRGASRKFSQAAPTATR